MRSSEEYTRLLEQIGRVKLLVRREGTEAWHCVAEFATADNAFTYLLLEFVGVRKGRQWRWRFVPVRGGE